MKRQTIKIFTGIAAVVILTITSPDSSTSADNTSVPPKKPAPEFSVDSIMDGLEKRYNGEGFTAAFYQESPLPEIQLIDTAKGTAYFKRPGKFRWEYESPDVLHYISGGKTLWIHSPADNQVWIGNAGDFFGKGSSTTLLTDIRMIRKQFDVSLVESPNTTRWKLKLIPRDTAMGLTEVYLFVSKAESSITKIVSFNINNEETRILFSDIKFNAVPDDSIFNFKVPESAAIVPME